MSEQHTPTPWVHNVEGYPKADVKGSNGRNIAHTWNVGASQPKSAEALKKRTEEDRANALRIVACVNACEGISTESLERSDVIASMQGERRRLETQRDDLLAVLERIAGLTLSQFMGPHDMALECVNLASAAIAKAGGAGA